MATNLPQKARDHFYGLCEAKGDLRGVALFDRLDRDLQRGTPLVETMWRRREIENYFCSEAVLLAYARHDISDDLFGRAEATQRTQHMGDAIQEVSAALETLGKPDPWSHDVKVSDDFLAPVFKRFFEKLKLPLTFRKSDYHFLARLKPSHEIDPEVIEKLDLIQKVAESAVPRR